MTLNLHKNNFKTDRAFTRQYFKILSPEFPKFLKAYIKTPVMRWLDKNSTTCGCCYSKLYNFKFFYSNLQHSIGVALIVWNFTKDKKATLAGLFHDISTPCFKHCIDYLMGDSETQESTEDLTEHTIKSSKEIMRLLQRDGIKLEEVVDYKLYPIADNELPRLSADRLEYTFSNGVFWNEIFGLEKIKKAYRDLTILTNENGMPELGFKTKETAEDFVVRARELWPLWYESRNKLLMQFIADTLAAMVKENLITVNDLYKFSEKQIIKKIKNCPNSKIAKAFADFLNLTNVFEGNAPVNNKYCKSIKSKRRWINPLVKTAEGAKRISDVSAIADEKIKNFLNYEPPKWAWFDLENLE